MSQEFKNTDNVEQPESKTPEQLNFEKFLAILEKHHLFDGGKTQIHNANPGFFSGAEGVVQQLGNKFADALSYFQTNTRKSVQYNKELSHSDLPDMQAITEESTPAPKGWVKGFSLFSREEKKQGSAPAMGEKNEHKNKTPHKP